MFDEAWSQWLSVSPSLGNAPAEAHCGALLDIFRLDPRTGVLARIVAGDNFEQRGAPLRCPTRWMSLPGS